MFFTFAPCFLFYYQGLNEVKHPFPAFIPFPLYFPVEMPKLSPIALPVALMTRLAGVPVPSLTIWQFLIDRLNSEITRWRILPMHIGQYSICRSMAIRSIRDGRPAKLRFCEFNTELLLLLCKIAELLVPGRHGSNDRPPA